MNTKQLKKWKATECRYAKELADTVRKEEDFKIQDFFPELDLNSPYTTSLDPYVPVWSLLPFFRTIIVGITPYFKTPDDFKAWYGLRPEQILQLANRGRIAIRVLFPHATASTPSFLNPFFELGFPSSARDEEYDRLLLSEEGEKEARQRFSHIVGESTPITSIDHFPDHKKRAYHTAERAYFQLLALGYTKEAAYFEELYTKNSSLAFNWLETCRLFLVGPLHYSLNGIHLVAGSAPLIASGLEAPGSRPSSLIFPQDIGKALINRLGLVRPKDATEPATNLQGILEIYPNYELARRALLKLAKAVKDGNDLAILNEANLLEEEISKFDKKADMLVRAFRYIGVITGCTISTLLGSLPGFLAGLGFGIATEALSPQIDHTLLPMGRRVAKAGRPPQLTALYDLAKDVREHFRS